MKTIHQNVGYWVSLLSRSMEAEFNRRLAPSGLTRMSYAVLGAIVFDGKTSPSEIAEFLRVDRGALTRWMDKLEAQDLIVRDTSKSDRRSVSIRATPQGEALAREVQEHSIAVNDQFIEGLGPEESERFVTSIKVMLEQAKMRPMRL